MLNRLNIKNLALIDELEVCFDKGLNILTGETGSGKSIIIGAIDLAFGARSNKDVIKTGSDKTFIELGIKPEKNFPRELLTENCIEFKEDNEIIISCEITKNSSRRRVNGTLVTQAYIQELRKYMLDIHTQHESYNYLNPSLHINLLDNYGKNEYGNILEDYKNNFSGLIKTKKDLENASSQKQENIKKIDFLKFQIQEIENAKIEDINEYEELKTKRNILLNSEELKNLTYSGYNSLYGEDQSITDSLCSIEKMIEKAESFDENLSEIKEIISSSSINLKEAAKELRTYSENLDTDPQLLKETENRLNELEKIRKKYGPELADVLENYEKFKNELNEINFSEEKISFLTEQVKTFEEKTCKLAKKISSSRYKLAEKLSNQILDELIKLEMPGVNFKVNTQSTNDLTRDGYDKVEFMISTNAGEPLKPLSKIASGGEVSRVMLAIKTIFSGSDMVNTVIFDEIDTGISGKTSQAVAEAFTKLAGTHQILCITHQPIIAAMADKHIHIKKIQDTCGTKIYVSKLKTEERLYAIASLASGFSNDEASINFARKLLDEANKAKLQTINL